MSLAARLQIAGYQVTVVEKNSYTGGRCSLIHRNGHRFDQGPSLLLLPKLFDEAFRDIGSSLQAEGIELKKCEPNYTVYYSDGEQIALSTSMDAMKREVERFEGVDGFEGFLGFLREERAACILWLVTNAYRASLLQAHRHYELSVDHVLHRSFDSLLAMLRPSFLRSVFVLHPFESIVSLCGVSFRGSIESHVV